MTDQERISHLRMPAINSMASKAGVEIDHVTFIPGGKTNESYIVYGTDSNRYLARIAGPGTEKFVDREKEMHNVAVADRLGVAPKLYCTDNNNLFLEYIDGTCTASQNILFFNENVDKITIQLRTLHSSKEPFKGEFSFIHDFHVYKADFMSTGFPVPDEMRRNEEELYKMTKWVDEHLSDDVCPIHSDVVMQNFIFTDERAYMIDWEYSTMSDRYLELASFCTQNILAPGVERLFLKSYFSDLDQKMDYDKFLLFKMSISFMWVYWHLNNVAHNKDAEYNEYRWRMHLNNAIMCKDEWEERQASPAIIID